MADTTRLDLDAHLIGAGRRNFSFDKFKRTVRPGNLHSSHLRHSCSLSCYLRDDRQISSHLPRGLIEQLSL